MRGTPSADHRKQFERKFPLYARDLLMPACVLEAIHALRSDQIMEACHVSRQSAEVRARRMELLHQRGAFGIHPLERKVATQFVEYIQSNPKNKYIYYDEKQEELK